jgi:membrane-associated phospholipid phosphatase
VNHVPDRAGHQDGGLRWPWLLVSALFALGLVVLAAAVRAGPLPIDETLRADLHVGTSVPFALEVWNEIGVPGIWDTGIAILAGLLVLRHRRIEAAWLGGGVLLGEVLSTAIKLIVDRQRPPGIAVIDLVTQASYPSGHVTRAVLTGALIVLLWRGGSASRLALAAIAVVVAVLMGLARILAGEHWPTDVVGAYLLVGSLIAVVAAIPERFRRTGPAPLAKEPVAPGEVPPRP